MSETQTAPCDKCKSEINVEAERCPECGYEPGEIGGIRRFIIVVFGVGFTAFGGLLVAIILLLVIAEGLALSTAVFGGIFFGFIFLVGVLLLFGLYHNSQRKPTDESIS